MLASTAFMMRSQRMVSKNFPVQVDHPTGRPAAFWHIPTTSSDDRPRAVAVGVRVEDLLDPLSRIQAATVCAAAGIYTGFKIGRASVRQRAPSAA